MARVSSLCTLINYGKYVNNKEKKGKKCIIS